MKKTYKLISVLGAGLLCLTAAGCGAGSLSVQTNTGAESAQTAASVSQSRASVSGGNTAAQTVSGGILDTADLFTDRDLEQEADLSEAVALTAQDGATLEITAAGVYVITGTAANCTVRVNAGDEDKVQLVLDKLEITNDSAPAVYVVSADKVFVTTAASGAALSVTGAFTADGDTNTDAVIFSKDDLTFNGAGTLTLTSSDNAISGKDDIKFTGGTYVITASGHGVEANDSIAVNGGSFTVNAGKDAFHAENDEDDTLGWIYVADGSFQLTAGSDGVHATTAAQIDGGTFTITAPEGIEATYVQINGGDLTITATDDGVNAGQKSTIYTPTFEMTGGTLTVSMGPGDTDAIDANGNIIVSGGTINITAPTSSFDYDGTATYTGGTIIVNGQQLDSIPQSMMGGPGGGMGGMPGAQGGMPGGMQGGHGGGWHG